MNLTEYNRIEHLDYLQYCDYLQDKYGIGRSNYMTSAWNINQKCKRTKDGLVAHHKFEDHAAKLSDIKEAKNYPYEWQMAKNIVYCDYLEHLYLHILICETNFKTALDKEILGIGGILQYIVPELNDVYSGWKTKQPWRATCHNKINADKEVYLTLIKRMKTNCSRYPFFNVNLLFSSFNDRFGDWDCKNNRTLFEEIKAL